MMASEDREGKGKRMEENNGGLRERHTERGARSIRSAVVSLGYQASITLVLREYRRGVSPEGM